MNKTILLLLCSLLLSSCRPIRQSAPPTNSQMRLGIVPHHEVAKVWIREFWENSALSKPHTIIVISPNHHDIDREKFVTADYSWQTEVGNVDSNKSIVDRLKQVSIVTVNNAAVSNDPGITVHIPYIKHFMPGVKIVPLLVSNYLSMEEINLLTKALMNVINPQTDIIIGSIDFSHYLQKTESEKKDVITQSLIEKGESKEIINLNNDYLDARSGLVLIQQLANQLGCKHPTFLHHGNSVDFLGGNSSNTTSYFVIEYTDSQCRMGN